MCDTIEGLRIIVAEPVKYLKLHELYTEWSKKKPAYPVCIWIKISAASETNGVFWSSGGKVHYLFPILHLVPRKNIVFLFPIDIMVTAVFVNIHLEIIARTISDIVIAVLQYILPGLKKLMAFTLTSSANTLQWAKVTAAAGDPRTVGGAPMVQS